MAEATAPAPAAAAEAIAPLAESTLEEEQELIFEIESELPEIEAELAELIKDEPPEVAEVLEKELEVRRGWAGMGPGCCPGLLPRSHRASAAQRAVLAAPSGQRHAAPRALPAGR